MSSKYTIHCFCFDCGTDWAEEELPLRCVTCNGTLNIATRRFVLNETPYTGFVCAGPSNRMYLEQVVSKRGRIEAVSVPLPRNLYTLDLITVDWTLNRVFDATGNTITTAIRYINESLGV